MKKILILMVGLLLIGVNAYAAGDLIVNGKLGVGTGGPINPLNVVGTNESKAIDAWLKISSKVSLTSIAAFYTTEVTETNLTDGRFIGFSGNTNFRGSGSNVTLRGATNIVNMLSNVADSTIVSASGNSIELRMGIANDKNHTITDYNGFHSFGNPAGSGSISGTNWRHAYFEDMPSFGGTVSNLAGLWIDQQTNGTNNYGIVLDGDGAGSDIVFGTSQEARIYSSGGELFVQDGATNVTLISPHDPETGEWIFYSKNVKTGKVVKVNMEKLVKAVEKLTGEKFMIETMVEGK